MKIQSQSPVLPVQPTISQNTAARSDASSSASAAAKQYDIADFHTAQEEPQELTKEQIQDLLAQARAQRNMYKRMAENANETAKAQAESFSKLGKCITIAIRLMNGDKIPSQDVQYLQKNNSELYQRAMLMRQQKKDPDEYDSVLDEEDDSSKAKAAQQENPDAASVSVDAAPAEDL